MLMMNDDDGGDDDDDTADGDFYSSSKYNPSHPPPKICRICLTNLANVNGPMQNGRDALANARGRLSQRRRPS